MSELPPSPERKGKYASARDEVLHAMSLEGWFTESGGDVSSAVGFFSWTSITPAELAEVIDAFTDVAHDAELENAEELIGNWVLGEDDQGNVQAVPFDTEDDARQMFILLTEAFNEDWGDE